MSADEIDEARKAIKRLVMPEDRRRTRRFAPGGRRARIDARRSFRRSLQPGGVIDLEFRSPIDRAPPVVALCDISGSMNEYTACSCISCMPWAKRGGFRRSSSAPV